MLEEAAREIVEAKPLGAAKLDDAVHWRAGCDVGQHGGYVGGRLGLEEHRRQAHDAAVGRRVDDPTDELEELRRADDRVRDRSRLHGFLLGHLRAEVAAVRQTVGPDDRQRDMVADAGASFRREDVARGGLEEVQHRCVVPQGRVRHVDDGLGGLEGFGQPLAGDRVDARVRRRSERLVTRLVEDLHEPRSDEAGSTDDDDLHFVPLSLMGARVGASADRVLLLWSEDRGGGCALESADAPAWDASQRPKLSEDGTVPCASRVDRDEREGRAAPQPNDHACDMKRHEQAVTTHLKLLTHRWQRGSRGRRALESAEAPAGWLVMRL